MRMITKVLTQAFGNKRMVKIDLIHKLLFFSFQDESVASSRTPGVIISFKSLFLEVSRFMSYELMRTKRSLYLNFIL